MYGLFQDTNRLTLHHTKIRTIPCIYLKDNRFNLNISQTSGLMFQEIKIPTYFGRFLNSFCTILV